MQSITFDEVLGLEEQFYEDGFQQGLAEGVNVGRIEGRTFGLEKGFEKYVESGRLKSTSLDQNRHEIAAEHISTSHHGEAFSSVHLAPLPDNQRLVKHVKVLYALAESESLSTENTEEAVSNFDDRLKRAQAKAKIIERMAGEAIVDADGHGKIVSSNDGSIEDVSVLKAGH